MRRVLLSALFVALMMALALPATAGKPSCYDDPSRPWCDDTTPPTTTTTTTPDQIAACTDTLIVTGKGNASIECLWMPDRGDSVDPPSIGSVTISDLWGGVSGPPTVLVRDDSPGDICLLTNSEGFEWELGTGPTYTAAFDLIYGPAETLPEGYDDWADSTYWSFIYNKSPEPPIWGAHWCAPQDHILESLRYDTNGSPLHLMVSFNARSGGGFTITLSPGQS